MLPSTLDPDAPPFVLPLPAKPASEPSAKKTRAKKSESSVHKDPKDVEIDFLKRELNIVKVHLLEHEAEVKDLKRKNKVLSDAVAMFENNQQKQMSDKYSTPTTLSSPANPCSSCSCSPSSHHPNTLEPNVINKLVDLLTDVLKQSLGSVTKHMQ